MSWGNLARPEIESKNKNTIVMVPLGSTEQHGLHLPVLTDTFIVTRIAERVKSCMGDRILLLPTLWLGASDHHLDFAGTISVGVHLYSEMIKSIAQSILTSGFRKIFFLNGHGGNDTPASQALQDLINESEAANSAYLTLGTYWHIASSSLAPERHGMEQKFLNHAGEYETSMMLFINRDAVALEKAFSPPPVYAGKWWRSDHPENVRVYKRLANRTSTGSLGSPEKATAKKGESLIKAIVEDTVSFLEEFTQWPPTPNLIHKAEEKT